MSILSSISNLLGDNFQNIYTITESKQTPISLTFQAIGTVYLIPGTERLDVIKDDFYVCSFLFCENKLEVYFVTDGRILIFDIADPKFDPFVLVEQINKIIEERKNIKR
jgi:hypothetical protein